jgi:hypothetical protein
MNARDTRFIQHLTKPIFDTGWQQKYGVYPAYGHRTKKQDLETRENSTGLVFRLEKSS